MASISATTDATAVSITISTTPSAQPSTMVAALSTTATSTAIATTASKISTSRIFAASTFKNFAVSVQNLARVANQSYFPFTNIGAGTWETQVIWHNSITSTDTLYHITKTSGDVYQNLIKKISNLCKGDNELERLSFIIALSPVKDQLGLDLATRDELSKHQALFFRSKNFSTRINLETLRKVIDTDGIAAAEKFIATQTQTPQQPQ